jgi:hypothetical protein
MERTPRRVAYLGRSMYPNQSFFSLSRFTAGGVSELVN